MLIFWRFIVVYVDRKYRDHLSTDLVTFEIKIKDTDLLISVKAEAYNSEIVENIQRYTYNLRNELENYILSDSDFKTTLEPYIVGGDAPFIAQQMVKYANIAGAGPMAAVAGGFSEMVGKYAAQFSEEVIVENGGDIFIKAQKPRNIGIFAGKSPFSNKVAIKVFPHMTPLGICTSSGTVGPSLSFGKIDAAIIIAKSTFLADAVATATGNRVHDPGDFDSALNFAQHINGVKGIMLIKEDKMAVWGDIELVRI